MPLRNRVTPDGRIIAAAARGTMMGNRGILHDEHRRIVRTQKNIAWLICLLEFKGRRRAVMSPGTYTELFFLDEAVALAAGTARAGSAGATPTARSSAPSGRLVPMASTGCSTGRGAHPGSAHRWTPCPTASSSPCPRTRTVGHACSGGVACTGGRRLATLIRSRPPGLRR